MKPLLLVSIGLGCLTIRATEPAFQVEVDYSTAPVCEAFAVKSKAIVEALWKEFAESLLNAPQP